MEAEGHRRIGASADRGKGGIGKGRGQTKAATGGLGGDFGLDFGLN